MVWLWRRRQEAWHGCGLSWAGQALGQACSEGHVAGEPFFSCPLLRIGGTANYRNNVVSGLGPCHTLPARKG